MKKKVIIGISIGMLIMLCVLIYSIVTRLEEKKVASVLTQSLPEFEMPTLNNRNVSNLNLKNDTPVILFFFHSECEYCQHEAQEIEKKIELFSKTQILFISAEELETIKRFSIEYKLYNHDNIYFMADRDGQFASRIEATTNPYILIYDSKHKLLKRFKGQTKPEAILNLLQIDF